MFPCHQPYDLLSSKDEHVVFNVCNDLSAFCAPGTDRQALTNLHRSWLGRTVGAWFHSWRSSERLDISESSVSCPLNLLIMQIMLNNWQQCGSLTMVNTVRAQSVMVLLYDSKSSSAWHSCCIAGFQSSEVESWKLYHLDYTTNGRMSLIQQILRQTGVGRWDRDLWDKLEV